MVAAICIKAFRHGDDDSLQFKQIIRMDFGARHTGLRISEAADILGFSNATICQVDTKVQKGENKIQRAADVWTKRLCLCQMSDGKGQIGSKIK